MSNPTNQFEAGLTETQFLDAWGDYLQGKVDKRGGKVPAAGSNKRLSSEWMNLVDDLILAVAGGSIGGVAKSEIISNVDSPVAIGNIGVGNTVSTSVDVVTEFNQLEILWAAFTRTEIGEGGEPDIDVEIATDNAFEDSVASSTLSPSGNPFQSARYDSVWKEANGLILSPYAGELEEPVAGTRRFYLRVRNSGVATSSTMSFAYVIRAFDISPSLSTIADQGIPAE